MNIDIASFALPNTARTEIRFEDPHDINRLVIVFRESPPDSFALAYAQLKWPDTKLAESNADIENPCAFGWAHSDDWFNCQWQLAAIRKQALNGTTLQVEFEPLSDELPGQGSYPVRFRRTLGIRLQGVSEGAIQSACVYTESPDSATDLRITLDCGRASPRGTLTLTGHNANVTPTEIDCSSSREFDLHVEHMTPQRRYSGDEGLVTLVFGEESFTISLTSLHAQGPIWFEALGVFVRLKSDEANFDAYLKRVADAQTLLDQVRRAPEQSLARAMHGQPRPHGVSYILACPLHPQRFRLEPNGDLVLERKTVTDTPAKPNRRFRNKGNARFYFGLEHWIPVMRAVGPSPSPDYSLRVRCGQMILDQTAVAVPLGVPFGSDLSQDDTIVALLRFEFANAGDSPEVAALSVRYSPDSARARNPRDFIPGYENDHCVPISPLEPLTLDSNRLLSQISDAPVLRCMFSTNMDADADAGAVTFHRRLEPGETCELLLKVPYVAIDGPKEILAIEDVDFDASVKAARQFWRGWCNRGAQIKIPELRLDDLHRAHLMHVAQTDLAMPDGSRMINTSVGTSTYGNFSNESCMIIHDLHERGLFDDARRRLEIWIKYQGTVTQPGNFSDCRGMYFGAGGFEQGAYNQHHGWVLWCLAQHYLFTRDRQWLKQVADSLLAGCDWVFRQRKLTQMPLPHSRGWERGFLPAGSLEDVTDFYYWLSTNSLTWRGVDLAAAALADINHPDAPRMRRETDQYRADLIRGFEINSQHAPLVRLRNGRWVPHYPSRLYCRGRDIGWIRETLEGSIYLLLSGLYSPNSKTAEWILEDYQDNRYASPPFGYSIADFAGDWFCRAGFSIQPTLLAGLLPHLDRDEPEIAIWMFFNAFAACYRDEIGALVEHPFPQLGYSNAAHFKTSDQSNAMVWLRHLLVHYTNEGLYLGRAIPLAWLATGQPVLIQNFWTPFGKVCMRQTWDSHTDTIVAEIGFSLHTAPRECILRLRHPKNRPVKAMEIGGIPISQFDAERGTVNLTGISGEVTILARY